MSESAAATRGSSPSAFDRAFARSITLPIIGALALALLISLAAILWLARTQNDNAAANAAKLLSQLVTARGEGLKKLALDYAGWDEGFVNMHLKLDPAWIDENVGSWTHEQMGVEMAFVVGPDGNVVYGSVEGKGGAATPLAFLGDGFASLLDASRAADPRASERWGVVATKLGLALAAAATIRPLDATVPIPPGDRSSLLLIDLLDAKALGELAAVSGLAQLRLAPAASAAGEGVTLRSVDGFALATFLWRPERPGTALAGRLLPALGLLVVLVGAFSVVSLRQMRHAATALTRSEARARHLAMYDPLTGLVNRSCFKEHLAAASADRSTARSALILLDLDGFREVNDTLGRGAGDALLRGVATRLLTSVRQEDVVARLDGDQFALLRHADGRPETVEVLAARLLRALAEPMLIDGQQVTVAASIGIAIAPPGGGGEQVDLEQQADIALEVAKKDSRGGYRFFASEMNERLLNRARVLAALRRAVQKGAFDIAFQPRFGLRQSRLIGVEALLRWSDPELGPVPPGEFIPLAEEHGLIGALGSWVLHRACATAVGWDDIRLSVNLSPLQFRDPGLVATVAETLAATGFPAQRLELEITETALFADPARAMSRVEELRGLGITIAMDDFGTGYSSLSQLSSFPVDTLKIDRSFVAKLGEGRTVDAIVGAILSLGEALGVNIVAEGVETSAQLDQLRRFGCHEVQGFYLARPMPAAELQGRLRAMADGGEGGALLAAPVSAPAMAGADPL